MKSLLLLFAPLSLTGLFAVTSVIAQGSLTPPGAPAATMKTLDQLDAKLDTRIAVNATNTPGSSIVQFIISSPGSYYLPASFTAATGRSGISITADDVTLDLRGNTVTGVAGGLSGINFANRLRVRVHNGIIRSFPAAGINAGSSEGTVLENLIVEGCGTSGILVGFNARLTDCQARNNTGASNGIQTNNGAIVVRCHAIGNGGGGIAPGAESTVRDSVARANGADGIILSTGCVVTHCVATDNAGAGLFTTSGVGLVIEHCVARDNAGFGIIVGGDSLVSHCTANSNTGGGIQGGAGSTILANVCASHNATATTPGIRVLSSGSRVEGNSCRGNGRGYESSASPNLFLRNLARSNTTNYSLSGTGAGVFVTEAQIATNTDPHANFDF